MGTENHYVFVTHNTRYLRLFDNLQSTTEFFKLDRIQENINLLFTTFYQFRTKQPIVQCLCCQYRNLDLNLKLPITSYNYFLLNGTIILKLKMIFF